MKKLPFFKKKEEYVNEISEELTEDLSPKSKGEFTGDFEMDIKTISTAYSSPLNTDFTVREFCIHSSGKKAVLFYIPSLAEKKRIEEEIIKPLLMSENETKDVASSISAGSVMIKKTVKDAIKSVNEGDTLLLVEGDPHGYLINTGVSEGRGVEKPQNETTLFGAKESFVEKLGINISLLRKRMHTEDLVVEKMVVGKRSNNEVVIVYNKSLVGEEILHEVKTRIEAIDKDAVQNISLLAQYMEDRKKSMLPTILQTERPDRVTSFIEDGYVGVLMDNSPFGLVAPATFWSFFHSADDHYLRFFFGNFTRLLRMFAMFITLFVPAIYIAITNYHIEMIPLDLLLAITGARETVPFPAVMELLFMEIAFELIREAGIRVPTPIGPTIGIVGALILGQAAVEANIVSPIVVIVVALTGLASFAIADVNLNYAIRIARFIFLLAASLFGIFGMVSCFISGLFYVVVMKSFGVPYFAPLTPKYKSSGDTLFRRILSHENLRPAYVKTKDITKDGSKTNGN